MNQYVNLISPVTLNLNTWHQQIKNNLESIKRVITLLVSYQIYQKSLRTSL